MKRVFLDAACWVAATGSPIGGSARIISLANSNEILLVANRIVLKEAERNVRLKFQPIAVLRFYQLVFQTNIEIWRSPSVDEEARWKTLVPDKDLHVLAGALKGQSDVLVSLDRKHILTDHVRLHYPVLVQDTKEFLEEFTKSEEL